MWVPKRWRRQFVVAKIQSLEHMMQELDSGLEDVKVLWEEVVCCYEVDYFTEGRTDHKKVDEGLRENDWGRADERMVYVTEVS